MRLAAHRLHASLYLYFFFFFNDTATTEIYTLSLHDALPIYPAARADALDHAGERGPPQHAGGFPYPRAGGRWQWRLDAVGRKRTVERAPGLIGERPWAAINRPWARDHSCPGRTAAARATGVPRRARRCAGPLPARGGRRAHAATRARSVAAARPGPADGPDARRPRSEEHTSELQSQSNIVCRLLLEKKKKHYNVMMIAQQCY